MIFFEWLQGAEFGSSHKWVGQADWARDERAKNLCVAEEREKTEPRVMSMRTAVGFYPSPNPNFLSAAEVLHGSTVAFYAVHEDKRRLSNSHTDTSYIHYSSLN